MHTVQLNKLNFQHHAFLFVVNVTPKKPPKVILQLRMSSFQTSPKSPLSEHSLLEVCIVNNILKKTEMPAVLSSCYYNNGIICQISQNPRIQLTTKSLPAVDSILQQGTLIIISCLKVAGLNVTESLSMFQLILYQQSSSATSFIVGVSSNSAAVTVLNLHSQGHTQRRDKGGNCSPTLHPTYNLLAFTC